MDIRVNVRAEDLPFRSQQRGVVTIASSDQPPIEVPVTARVSLGREVWRLVRKALSAALPESWAMVGDAWGLMADATRAINRTLARHGWLVWLIWALLGAAMGAGLYLWPPGLVVPLGDLALTAPQAWMDYVLPVLVGPPVFALGLWLFALALSLVGGAIGGFLRGVYKSLVR
ncbi:MAG: hypothetical protein V1772_01740 [Chloroflexota bacterium]